MLSPTSLPYVPPQPRDLGAPDPALRERTVAGLFLSSPAPPAPVVLCLIGLVLEVWLGGCVPRQELAVAAEACYRLTRPAKGSTLDALSAGGAVLPLRPNMDRDPLGPPMSLLVFLSVHLRIWSLCHTVDGMMLCRLLAQTVAVSLVGSWPSS